MATNNVAATSLSPDPLRLDAVEGESICNTDIELIFQDNGYDYKMEINLFEFILKKAQ